MSYEAALAAKPLEKSTRLSGLTHGPKRLRTPTVSRTSAEDSSTMDLLTVHRFTADFLFCYRIQLPSLVNHSGVLTLPPLGDVRGEPRAKQ